MKKFFALSLSLALAFALAACGNTTSSSSEAQTSEPEANTSEVQTSEVQTSEVEAEDETEADDGALNGTYTATMDEDWIEANRGYRDELVVTYEDGVIVSATYDSYNEDGLGKSENEDYPMDPSPIEWIPELNAMIVEAGSSADFDGLAGATSSSDNVRALLAAIETEGVAGETIVVSES